MDMLYFRYQNTNCYLIPAVREEGLLAFDAGWPCSLHEYARSMKETGFGFSQIRWAIVSHFHMDHAGLIRAFLRGLGIDGEVIQTPGHTDDSVSLITDGHDVLIGDLYPVSQIMPEDARSNASWARIKELGGRQAWPSHAEAFIV